MKKKLKKEIIKKNALYEIAFTLNGKKVSCKIKPSTLLLDLIRDNFSLKGTKPGCNEGECGACAVLINDMPVNSCLYLAINADGKEITTIEGLAKNDGSLDLVQEALVQNGAVQCGFCTSGMAISIKAMENNFKKKKKKLSREEIKKELEGNLCRCTGYVKIIDAAESVIDRKYI